MSKDLKIISEILMSLVKSTQITQTVIVDQNGLPITSWDEKVGKLSDETENRISALVASVFLLSEKTSNIFNQGIMQQMFIKNERGKILITNINDQSLIIIVMKRNAPEALTLLQLKKACEKLKKLDILNPIIEVSKDTSIFIPDID